MISDEVTIYNRHTDFKKRGKPPIIRIDAHSGNARITISVEAVRLLKLKEGDALSFMTLKNDAENIYFYKDKIDGIPLKIDTDHKSGSNMAIYCRPLARKLLDHFGINSMRSFIITDAIVECQGKKCFVIDRFKTYTGKYKPNGKK